MRKAQNILLASLYLFTSMVFPQILEADYFYKMIDFSELLMLAA